MRKRQTGNEPAYAQFLDWFGPFVVTPTRPEETYKMLGRLENVRGLFDTPPFNAALCFLSDADLFTEIKTEREDHLVLVCAQPDDPAICAFGGRMDTVVSQ